MFSKRVLPLLLVSALLLTALTACESSNTATAKPEPVLSDTLKTGCGNPGVYATDATGLAVGSKAINFTLKDVNGNPVRLSSLLAEKPVVIIFGSFS